MSAASPAAKTGTTTAAKAASPTAIPKLNDIAYTLSLDPGQEYSGASTPVYLRANQILRMNWQVVKGGNHFHLTFNLPNAKQMAVRNNGTLAEYGSAGIIPEDLTKNGSLVIRPADNDWDEGYYIFFPHILAGDTAVTIKLIYWIEG
ncbi:MAG TPA: hypothetical protein VLH15_10700 [Dehalococcoidales bacterium]|nr:hypothetical protein [Dehalococcoidales bacterium]